MEAASPKLIPEAIVLTSLDFVRTVDRLVEVPTRHTGKKLDWCPAAWTTPIYSVPGSSSVGCSLALR